MRNTLIYDLPTRLFHFLFSSLFVSAFMIAKTVDDESPIFSYHMLAGLMLGAIVIFRVYWGLFGSEYSRFSSLALRPTDLLSYLRGILSGDKKLWSGHNPASSWATVIMLALSFGLAVTGVLMTTGHKEEFEDLHEVLANGFLITVLLHVSGVIFHVLRHRDGIAFSMIDGKKQTDPGAQPSKSHWAVAVMFIILVSIFSGYLIRNYNMKDGTLDFLGTRMVLMEE